MQMYINRAVIDTRILQVVSVLFVVVVNVTIKLSECIALVVTVSG